MNGFDKESELILGILDSIDKRNDISQRGLAHELGVALGLTNSYIKRCIKKGLIKVNQAPANRYFYYLTPKGFAEKSRLTGEYLHASLEFYRRAGSACISIFEDCIERRLSRLSLYGISDLTEIALIKAQAYGEISLLAIYDQNAEVSTMMGIPVYRHFNHMPATDGWLITALDNPVTCRRDLSLRVNDRSVIFTPEIFGTL